MRIPRHCSECAHIDRAGPPSKVCECRHPQVPRRKILLTKRWVYHYSPPNDCPLRREMDNGDTMGTPSPFSRDSTEETKG